MTTDEFSGICRSDIQYTSPPTAIYGSSFPSGKAAAGEPSQSATFSDNEREEKERSFMRRLKTMCWERYFYYQNEIKDLNSPELMGSEDAYEAYAAKKRYPYYPVNPLDLGDVRHYSFGELKEITDSFNQKNLIRKMLFGRLFSGTVAIGKGDEYGSSGLRDVIVRTWDFYFPPDMSSYLNPARIHDEISILTDSKFKSDPRVMKLIGFHCDKMLAVVYEKVPLRFLADIITSDNFEWDQRMKVALNIGELLKEFHDKGIVHGAIDSGLTLIDENYFPKSFRFKVYSYFEDRPDFYDSLAYRRYAPYLVLFIPGPAWPMEYDVFAYGVFLLELIGKQSVPGPGEAFDMWFLDLLKGKDLSFVHESFNNKCNEWIGSKITRCAVQCLGVEDKRPGIGEVLEELKMLVNAAHPAKVVKTSD